MSILKITSKNYEQEVSKSEVPVLLDFWASWCGHCGVLAPILDEVSKELEDKAKIGKINIDDEEELAERFRITSIPTLIIIKNREIKNQSVGVLSKEEILDLIKRSDN